MLSVHTNDNNEFLLELGQLSKAHTEFLSHSFNNLPNNPYMDGEYRVRRYSHFTFVDDSLTLLPHQLFNQSSVINHFQGGVVRDYEEIEKEVIENEAFLEMFHHFKDMAHVDEQADIEVHQIRIIAKEALETPVAPEGIHQDGFDRIGIFVIDREHIQGGGLSIYKDKNERPFVFHTFDHGEFVILNDRKFWHGAETIMATDNEDAHMDVFVLTAKV